MTVRVAGPGFGPATVEVAPGSRVRDLLESVRDRFADPVDLSKITTWVDGERVDPDRELHEEAQVLVMSNFVGGF
jgi:sulfur carrier protein ThiS